MADNKYGKSSLHRAVLDANVEKVRLLILHGADVNARDIHGRIPMPRYPWMLKNAPQQVKILKLLVEAGADLASCDSARDMQVSDVLHYGTREIVRIIIQSKMDLYAKYEGVSALHYLAKNKNAGIVEELRRRPFVSKMCGALNASLFSLEIGCMNPRMVEFFLQNGFESRNVNSAFLISARITKLTEEIIEIIELLLEYEVDPMNDLYQYLNLVFQWNDEYPRRKLLWPIIKQVVAHLAIQDLKTHSDDAFSLITSNPDVKVYYESCKKQLEEMKTKTIHELLTFFELLVPNEKKRMSFASDSKLILKLKDIIELPRSNKFYGRIIYKRLLQIFKIAEYRKKSITKICLVFGRLYDDNYIITKNIASFLNYEDLERLTLFGDE